MCSPPNSSGVSHSTVVAPWETIQSDTSPMSGLEPRPLEVSEPPQFVPKMSSETGTSSRSQALAARTSSRAMRVPSSTALMEPPTFWMTSERMGLSQRLRMASTTRSFWQPSQPRDTARTA